MINLTTLEPDIRAAILNETLPEEVALFDLAADTPQCWEVQRRRIVEAAARAGEGKRVRFRRLDGVLSFSDVEMAPDTGKNSVTGVLPNAEVFQGRCEGGA